MKPRKRTDYLVIHCSATPPSRDIGRAEIDAWHKARTPPFEMIGYHYVIRRSGNLEVGRPSGVIGAHVAGYNDRSIGICLVGGVKEGKVSEAENNFTPEQFARLRQILRDLKKLYPDAKIVGHRDLSPDQDGDGVIEAWEYAKMCPSFDAMTWARDNGLQDLPSVEQQPPGRAS